MRIAASDCNSCSASCLEGLSDWRTPSGRTHICHAHQCGTNYCVLFDTAPDAQPQPIDGALTHEGGAAPADTQCIRRSSAAAWSDVDDAPLPPSPPSPPPPPSPLTPVACDGRVALHFPPVETKLASLGVWADDLTRLPESFVDGHRRCDATAYNWYEGVYTLDGAGRLAGTSATASRPLLVGGAGGAFLWWRPAANWSRTPLNKPQNLAGWVVTDEAPALALSVSKAAPDRLLPPDKQSLGAREAIYHMPAFTAGRIPTSESLRSPRPLPYGLSPHCR